MPAMHLYPPVGPPPTIGPVLVLVLVLIWEEDVLVSCARAAGAALVEAEARAEAAVEEGSTTEPNAANRVWRPCCVRAESPQGVGESRWEELGFLPSAACWPSSEKFMGWGTKREILSWAGGTRDASK